MPESYVILWTQERCRWLKRVGDAGPLAVVFGGPHISLPSIDRLRLGDFIYPVHVSAGSLFVVAGMEVEALQTPDQFVRDRLGIERPPYTMWDQFFISLKRTRPSVGHRVPSTCADTAASGANGSAIQFDREVPSSTLDDLRLGPKAGCEEPLKGLEGGKLKHNLSLHGHMRRLSSDSAARLHELL